MPTKGNPNSPGAIRERARRARERAMRAGTPIIEAPKNPEIYPPAPDPEDGSFSTLETLNEAQRLASVRIRAPHLSPTNFNREINSFVTILAAREKYVHTDTEDKAKTDTMIESLKAMKEEFNKQ